MEYGGIGWESVVTGIRIYVEGGGDGRTSKRALRQGFGGFFDELRSTARDRKIRWDVIICGSRQSTFKLFRNSLIYDSRAFNILLFDSEEPVTAVTTWAHVK